MKYITHETTGGRSGHILKDIFTAYILSFLIDDLKVLPIQTWNQKQAILKFPVNEDLKDYKFSRSINICETAWAGMSFDAFCKIKNQIANLPDNCLIRLIGHTRIQAYQLSEWFQSGLIKEDVFIEKFIPTLRDLYFKDNNSEVLDCLSIHVRRGDIANPNNQSFFENALMRWPVEYFKKNIILFRKKIPSLPINIFTEKDHSDDLEMLNKYNNLKIHRGDIKSLKNDINKMANSKYFMPCNSSLSTWISYISKNSIIMPEHKKIKHFHSEHIW